MQPPPNPAARCAPVGAALLLAAVLSAGRAAASAPLEDPVHSPTARLAPERLAATRASVRALAASRRSLPPPAGLRDLRCNFHAHAGDSTHTGGTPPEMLAGALEAGVDAVFLSDHFRPPRDFMDSWRLVTNGVRFVPGSECRGFLIHPEATIMPRMDDPLPGFIATVTAGDGLAFLSHVEERPDHPMDGLTGLEIYNRHYDAKRDLVGLLGLASRMTDPAGVAALGELVREYPAEVLGAQVQYPQVYLDKWDRETARRRLVGVGANDCHHNQVFIVKMVDRNTVLLGTVVDRDDQMREITAAVRPGIRRLTDGRQPGDIVARVDFDPYPHALRTVATHILAPDTEEATLRRAVKAGRVYVAHEWMADPTGFRFELAAAPDPGLPPAASMGDEMAYRAGLTWRVESPVPGRIRVVRDGVTAADVTGVSASGAVPGPGVYRVEIWLELGGEWRAWLYSNPIYLRTPAG